MSEPDIDPETYGVWCEEARECPHCCDMSYWDYGGRPCPNCLYIKRRQAKDRAFKVALDCLKRIGAVPGDYCWEAKTAREALAEIRKEIPDA